MVFQLWSNPTAFSQSLAPSFSWPDWNRVKLAAGRGLWLGTDGILGRVVTQTLHKQVQEWACWLRVLQPQGVSPAPWSKRKQMTVFLGNSVWKPDPGQRGSFTFPKSPLLEQGMRTPERGWSGRELNPEGITLSFASPNSKPQPWIVQDSTEWVGGSGTKKGSLGRLLLTPVSLCIWGWRLGFSYMWNIT